MAKSIRSKWKRKCRAIKRERYAVKELARLKNMLGIKGEENTNNTIQDEVMSTINDQVIFLDANKLPSTSKSLEKENIDEEMSSDDEKVDISGQDGKKRTYSTKTMKDQNGQYPAWLHKRKIAKMNKTVKKNIKKKSKKRRKKH